jgi:CRISPR-associated endonuclease/helicase Cas3
MNETLGRVCSEEEVRRMVTTRLEGKPPRSFQRNVEDASSRVVFVRAGCGTGKTVGAYLWAAKKAVDKKLFVCYPTTGTATEGYKDYELAAKIDSRLMHSRAEVDLERLLEGSEDTDVLEYSIKYNSLQAYDVPMVVATADTVLGLIQNNRTGLFSFPSIGEAAFIFDEIHSYDRLLFGALLRFIDTFRGVPILLLTASLQSGRIRLIEEVLGKNGEKLEVVRGPKELEDIDRYVIHWCGSSYPWDEVKRSLAKGEKVLWVVNTVERARQLADEANNRLAEIKVELYHSRYRYCDRVDRHTAVMDGFSARKKGPLLAITTQVCEVSLDISADLMVTDNAPIPALIQRMGRVNRFVKNDSDIPKHVYVVETTEDAPYESSDLLVAKKWLSLLEKRDAISQSVLDDTFRDLEEDESNIPMDSSWLDGGPLSKTSPLRESGYTISVVRGEDLQEVKKNGKVINSELGKYTIPMLYHPVAKEIKEWQRLNGVFVAPVNRMEYSVLRGGLWRRKD